MGPKSLVTTSQVNPHNSKVAVPRPSKSKFQRLGALIIAPSAVKHRSLSFAAERAGRKSMSSYADEISKNKQIVRAFYEGGVRG